VCVCVCVSVCVRLYVVYSELFIDNALLMYTCDRLDLRAFYCTHTQRHACLPLKDSSSCRIRSYILIHIVT